MTMDSLKREAPSIALKKSGEQPPISERPFPPKRADEVAEASRLQWTWRYLRPYRKHLFQLVLVVFTTAMLNFLIPVTNKAIVDNGVLVRDRDFIVLMIMAQCALYAGLIALHVLRGLMTLHVSSRMTIRMLWDFFAKLVFLPMGYFERTSVGEVLERVRDFDRVQRFASTDVLDMTSACITVLALAPLLFWIHWSLFLTFFVSAALYLLWVLAFRKFRSEMDGRRFRQQARIRATEVAMLRNIQDIKIAGRERTTLGQWERVQVGALRIQLTTETVEQWQNVGGRLLSRSGLMVISLMSAVGVVNGLITLGDMTVTTVISVQLYWQIDLILDFSKKLQDTSLSLDRLSSIARLPPEDADLPCGGPAADFDGSLRLKEVSFDYGREDAPPILQGVTLEAPAGSMLALVGPSGSGKSTLVKLMLKLHAPSNGQLVVGDTDLSRVRSADWRAACGAVMQDGLLFEDTVAANIVAEGHHDLAWLEQVIDIACCREIVTALPQGTETLVGEDGAALSAGQRQRLLIARAIYKRPKFLFLDEATSALDNENEARISANLRCVLPDTTRIVVAHRLSTVKSAEIGRAHV